MAHQFEKSPQFGNTKDSMDIARSVYTQSRDQFSIISSLESATSHEEEEDNLFLSTTAENDAFRSRLFPESNYCVEEVEHRGLKRASPIFDDEEERDDFYSVQSFDAVTKRRRRFYEVISRLDNGVESDCSSIWKKNVEDCVAIETFPLSIQEHETGKELNVVNNSVPEICPSDIPSVPKAIHIRKVSLEEAPCLN